MNPTGAARFLRKKTPLGIIRNLEIDNVTVITEIRIQIQNHAMRLILTILRIRKMRNYKEYPRKELIFNKIR